MLSKIAKAITNIDKPYYLKNGSFLLFSQILAAVSSLTIVSVLANYLTESQFGSYRYLLSIGGIIAILTLTGTNSATAQASTKKLYGTVKHLARNQHKYNFIGYSVGSTISIYYFVQGDFTLAIGILIASSFLLLSNSFQNIFSILAGQKRFLISTSINVIKLFIVTITTVITAVLAQDILYILFAFLGSALLVNVVTYHIFFPKNYGRSVENIKSYEHYAFHSSVRNGFNNIVQKIDGVLLFQMVGARELAIFHIANTLTEQAKGPIKSLTGLILPKYTQHPSIESIKKNIYSKSAALFIILTSIAAFLWVITPLLYTTLFPKYNESIELAKLLLLSLPATISLVPLTALKSQMKDAALYKTTFIPSFFQLIILLPLILLFGLLGAVIAKIVSRYFALGYYFYILLKVR